MEGYSKLFKWSTLDRRKCRRRRAESQAIKGKEKLRKNMFKALSMLFSKIKYI